MINKKMEDNFKIKGFEENNILEDDYYKIKYGLSSDFFENILYLESNLKEKFDLNIFFELISSYNKAIEYYESLNNKKFIIFNQALKDLFEQPEAKKFMEGKDLVKIFRKKELDNKFKQCEKIVTEEKVKAFLEKKLDEINILNSINNLYNNDINNQKEILEKKIVEKKLKYKNKKQNRNENMDNTININNINEVKQQKSEINIKIGEKADEINYNYQVKEKKDINRICNNSDAQGEIINLHNEENIDNKNNKNNFHNDLYNNKIDLKQSIKLTNKTRFSEKIIKIFDTYFISYYNYFINNKIDLIINDFNEKTKDSTKKGIESSVDIFHQIKDMEYVMKDNTNEDYYNNEILKIINELKEKQNKKIKNILNEIDNYSKNIDDKYLINDSLFKEQFKLDTTKLLNMYIFN